mmetsp:Transcript_18184/g.50601  ORF Transcript_18184/g.50601 Transcript_18184/m.50601 type:complete len:221 (-) Transcript_18184:1245-1907(-)
MTYFVLPFQFMVSPKFCLDVSNLYGSGKTLASRPAPSPVTCSTKDPFGSSTSSPKILAFSGAFVCCIEPMTAVAVLMTSYMKAVEFPRNIFTNCGPRFSCSRQFMDAADVPMSPAKRLASAKFWTAVPTTPFGRLLYTSRNSAYSGFSISVANKLPTGEPIAKVKAFSRTAMIFPGKIGNLLITWLTMQGPPIEPYAAISPASSAVGFLPQSFSRKSGAT